MGLWDTVGMIAVPKGDRFGLNSKHKFHYKNVCTLYQNVAHALSINETIDGSVFDHCRTDPTYRPKNLVAWAKRKGVDLGNATGDKNA
jgi:hypothetical protein